MTSKLNARTKGKNGEREATLWINTLLGTEVKRNLAQTRDAGSDITEIPGLEIEVKRQETLNIDAWWRQVCRAADENGNTPVLMYRQNRRKWNFCIPFSLLLVGGKGKVTLGEAEFSQWLQHWTSGIGASWDREV